MARAQDHAALMIASQPSNHRFERALTVGGWRVASALRHFALASHWTRLLRPLTIVRRHDASISAPVPGHNPTPPNDESKGELIMPTGTVRLHCVLRTKPERVYRAFLDADAMAKWLPPYGFTCKVHHMDAKVGGTYEMSFTNFTTGHGHSFGGEYRELVPFEKIRYTDRFDDPNLPGEMQTTVTLKQVSCGTEVNVVQEGLPEAIPVEMCYLGWQESLAQLAKLVEPEIPG
jgi:uncharacterized protein YndB with AHSA1/START domain